MTNALRVCKRADQRCCCAVTVISYFPEQLQSLMVVPCILGHLSQIFIDSFVVMRLNNTDEKRAAKEGAMPGEEPVRLCSSTCCLCVAFVSALISLPPGCRWQSS